MVDCGDEIHWREGLKQKARNAAKRSEDLERKARPEGARPTIKKRYFANHTLIFLNYSNKVNHLQIELKN
jgi:hypothetical protein